MHYAVLYIDTTHRIRIYPEGGFSLEKRIEGIGWCLEADTTAWSQEAAAFRELAALCTKHAESYPSGRIESGPEDYDATYDFPVFE